ncbi:MAG: cytochrome c-type biogenesis protein CcmH [Magnetococcus sp. YQC-5]
MNGFFRLLLIVLLSYPLLIQAESRQEDPTEAMVRNIAKDLRCAVCQNQSVYESNSDLAKDMLSIIRDKVQAGEQETTIRDYFFQRYGDYIYLEPTKGGMNWLLWGGPFVGLGVGAWALLIAMRKWRARSVQQNQEVMPVADEAMKKRIQQELDQVRL